MTDDPTVPKALCRCGHPASSHHDATGWRECLEGGDAPINACGCRRYRAFDGKTEISVRGGTITSDLPLTNDQAAQIKAVFGAPLSSRNQFFRELGEAVRKRQAVNLFGVEYVPKLTAIAEQVEARRRANQQRIREVGGFVTTDENGEIRSLYPGLVHATTVRGMPVQFDPPVTPAFAVEVVQYWERMIDSQDRRHRPPLSEPRSPEPTLPDPGRARSPGFWRSLFG